MGKFKPIQFSFCLIACLAIISCKPIKKRTFPIPLEAHQPQVPVIRNEFVEVGSVHQPAIVHSPIHAGSIAVKTNDECLELNANSPTMHVEHSIITPPAPPPWLSHLEPLQVQVTPHHPSILTHGQGLKHTIVEHVQHPIITPPAPPPAHVTHHHPSIVTHEQGLKHTIVEHEQHAIITPPAPPPALPLLEPPSGHHPSTLTHEQGLKHTVVQHPIITPAAPPPAPVAPHHPTILIHEQGPQHTIVEHDQHQIITAPAPTPANDCAENTIVESVERPLLPPPAPLPSIPFLPFYHPQPAQQLAPTITHQPALVAYDDCGQIQTAAIAAPPKLPILSPAPPAAAAPAPTPIAQLPIPASVPIMQDNCITEDTVEILPASADQPSHETFAETGPAAAQAFELHTEQPTHIIHPPQPPQFMPLPEFRIVAAPANVASQSIALPYAHITPDEPPKNVNLENVSITGIAPAPAPSAPNPSQSECIDLSSIFDWDTLVRQHGGGLQRTFPNFEVKK